MVVGRNLREEVGNPVEEDIVLEVAHRMLPEEDIVRQEDNLLDYMVVEVDVDIPVDREEEGIVDHKGVVHPEDRIRDIPVEVVLHIALPVEEDNREEAPDNMTLIVQVSMKTSVRKSIILKRVSMKWVFKVGGWALSLKGRILIFVEAVQLFPLINRIFQVR